MPIRGSCFDYLICVMVEEDAQLPTGFGARLGRYLPSAKPFAVALNSMCSSQCGW